MPVPPPSFLAMKFIAPLNFTTLCGLHIFEHDFGSKSLRRPLGAHDGHSRQRNFGFKPRHIGCRTKITAFFISACITGLAGGLMAHYVQYLSPEVFGILLSIQLLLMIVVGGLGTVHGAFFGAFLVGLLESLISISKDYLPGPLAINRAGARIIRSHSGFIYHL